MDSVTEAVKNLHQALKNPSRETVTIDTETMRPFDDLDKEFGTYQSNRD